MLSSVEKVFEQYDISHYGFLPVEEPLARLPHPYYQPWENIISNLESLIASGTIRKEIGELPILNTSLLQTVPEWRRAYVILSFFTHAHIWSGPLPNEVLPPCITCPLIDISSFLGLPPTATYPALNLWNCALRTPHSRFELTDPDNVIIRHTFTATPDERWFYAISVSVEAKGMKAVTLMLSCIDGIVQKDDEKILTCLRLFNEVILQIGQILHRMHEKCDPNVFYHQIRPFLAGSRGMERAGLPRGLFYDEGNGLGSWRQYSGGSNAQSTLIQFLDIALGVKHEATGSRKATDPIGRQTYLNEMRNYMPRSHRQFLEHFASIANIREYATTVPPESPVARAFDNAVEALTAFRDIHIKIVARYVVAPSRAPTPEQAHTNKNIASSSSATTDHSGLKGTGGTDLIAFLKQTRNETKAAGTDRLLCK